MIQIENLTIGYDKKVLLSGISANMKAGTLTALLGRNGSGKSTLLRAISGLGEIYGGRVSFNGTLLQESDPEALAKIIAFVTTEKIRITNLKCKDLVALGRAPYTNWIGRMQKEDEEIVMKSLAMVGMEGYAERSMDKMSDGECQRIMIARALAQHTPIILLDEPTSYLDLPNRYELCSLLQELAHKENKCILFSTHELDIALSLCDYIALIDTPHLHYMTAEEMKKSNHIERLFRNKKIKFDPETGTVQTL